MTRRNEFSPGAAAILSFFLPGLGQLCQGRFFAGLAFFIFTILGYLALFIPGVIMHLWAIVSAARR